MNKQRAHLENWYYDDGILYGFVTNHPKLPNGMWVHTSEVKDLDVENKTAVTRNNEYTLGEPNTNWKGFRNEI